MGTIYRLTLRQLLGRWRLVIMAALAAMPVVMAAVILGSGDAPSLREFEEVVFNHMLAGSIVPLVVLAIATPAFGNEVDDATLSNLTLAPIARWKIALPKLAAPVTFAGVFVGASAWITGDMAFLGDLRAILAVTAGSVAAVALYASVFTWLGLVTSRAVGLGLAYIVLWEGLFTGFVSGARLLSVRHHAIALMHGIDPRRFAEADPIGFGAAIGMSAVILVGFQLLTVRRLRTMDVP